MENSIQLIITRKHVGIQIKYCSIKTNFSSIITSLNQGEKQKIIINFDDKLVQIKEIHIKFQGGFSSSHCLLESSLLNNNKFETKIIEFYPDDTNSNQVSFHPILKKKV